MKKWLWILVPFILLVASGIAFLATRTPKFSEFHDPTTKSTLLYSSDSAKRELSQEDRDNKTTFKLGEVQGKTPFSVVLQYEDGLKLPSQISRTEPLKLVLDGANRSLALRKQFNKISSREFEQSGKQAAEIVFDYEGPAGEIVRQKLLMLIRDEDTAIYLSLQSRQADFENIQKEQGIIFSSLELKQ